MIPSFRLVEDVPDWGALVALVGGEHHGANVLLVPAARVLPRATIREGSQLARRRLGRLVDDRLVAPEESRKAEANRRAEALLVSLLDPDQRVDWERRRRFWVESPHGAVELGRVSHLRFDAHDGRHFTLCVVPTGVSKLPDADIWTNLLLVLRAEPVRFFDVANYCTPGGPWRAGPVPLPPPRPSRDRIHVARGTRRRSLPTTLATHEAATES
jgi:hypothetical protein